MKKTSFNILTKSTISKQTHKYLSRKIFKPSSHNFNMNKGRKISGGKYHKARKKKLYELVRSPRNTKLGKIKQKKIRKVGGGNKIILFSSDIANVFDKKSKKSKKVKIKNVVETPSNRFLARQNIITKGSIIETEIGKARVTNRPSQEGSVQAVLVE